MQVLRKKKKKQHMKKAARSFLYIYRLQKFAKAALTGISV